MENELVDLAKKFVARVEASPSTWQSGYPELAQEFRVAIKAAEQKMHPTPLTLFGMRVEIANWLKPGQWFIRPSRRG